MTPPFTPEASEAFAHHVHRLARGGRGAPISKGYAREDAAVRKGAGKEHARPPEVTLGDGDTVEAALAQTSCPPEDADWFHRRWELGEGASVLGHAARIADAANAFDLVHPLLPPGPWRVLVSVALTGPPTVSLPARAVAAAPGTSGALVAVAVLAASLEASPGFPDLGALPLADRHLVRLGTAGSILLRTPGMDEAALATLLDAVGPVMVGAVGSEAAYFERLDHLNQTLLHQPVGELQRMQKGLSKRRLDRLHRALVRDFFVPRPFDADRWMSEHLRAR